MSQKLIEALKKLDPSNDNHWTATGEARLDTVKLFCSDQGVTRESILQVAPSFSRANAQGYTGWKDYTPPAQNFAPNEGQLSTSQNSENKESEVNLEEELGFNNLEALEAQLAQLHKDKADLEHAINALNKLADPLRRKQDLETAKQSNAQVIQDYLNSQKAVLENRGKIITAVKDSGLSLKELSKALKSPIDAALQRKR